MKEALKLALEALECLKRDFDADQFEWGIADEAITAIKEALAQPEQEPVAVRDAREWEKVDMREHAEGNLGIGTAPPPKRKPLTDKQILADETLRYYFGQNGGAGPVSKQGRKVVDAIEAAHGIKE